MESRTRGKLRGTHVAKIAVIRNISPATASKHARNILHKLGVKNRQDAAMEVVREIICRADCWPE